MKQIIQYYKECYNIHKQIDLILNRYNQMLIILNVNKIFKMNLIFKKELH